ncbi:hypothetical protein BKA69DRAFT_385886 [Paraphysoderma sedebokerense]|nr:hypothetical protein BKA69DRAFT_385886 [Paraphysoderma sedebokerense]
MGSSAEFAVSMALVASIALAMNIILLITVKRMKLTSSPTHILILCLCIVDTFDSSWNLPFFVLHATSGVNVLATHPFACKMNGLINQAISSFVVTTVVLLACERYIQICTRYNVGKSQTIKAWAAVQLFNITTVVACGLIGAEYVLQPSEIFCFVRISSNQRTNRITRNILLCGLNGAFVLIFGFYMLIYHRVRKSQRKLSLTLSDSGESARKNSASGPSIFFGVSSNQTDIGKISTPMSPLSPSPSDTFTSQSTLSRTAQNIQRTLLFRSIAICLVVVVCWSVYNFVLWKSAITGRPVSATLDSWGIYFVMLHGILNPLLVFTTDSRFRKPIERLLIPSDNRLSL